MSQKNDVKIFLDELRSTISIGELFFLNRPKNSIQHLADLGITSRIREDIIKGLEVEDYCQGPLIEDQNNGKSMWVFGKIYSDTELYIKISIIENTFNVICISFHISEHPMSYPLNQLKT